MSKKLPGIYHAPISSSVKNNDRVFYSLYGEAPRKNVEVGGNVLQEVDRIFKEEGYLFNKEVIITTKDRTYQTALVSRNKKGIITLDNDYILYDDIVSFQRKK